MSTKIAYSICMLFTSLSLITMSQNLFAQDAKPQNPASTAVEKPVAPIKPILKPQPTALYLELLKLNLPQQKPKAPASMVQKAASKGIIPESKPWDSESSDKSESSNVKGISPKPKKMDHKAPQPPKYAANAPTVKVRPSNHMLGLTVGEAKKAREQTKQKVNAPKKPVKVKQTANKSTPKRKKKKSKARKAPPTQIANTSFQACQQALSRYDIAYSRLSNIYASGGCALENGLEVTRIQGVQIKPAAKLNCDMVVRTAKFIDNAQNSAATYFGSRIERLNHMSAYSCRRRPSGKVSEHGFGNALDVGSVKLSNGISTSVLRNWYSDGTVQGDALSKFWYDVAGYGCDTYRLVLSPVSNADHKNHLHFDAGRWTLCER